MGFKQILKKIESSGVFKNFKSKYQDAELYSGFFILDFLGNDSKNSLNYKTSKKVFIFSLNEKNEITVQEDKYLDNQKSETSCVEVSVLTKLKSKKIKVELEDLKKIAELQALDNGINSEFHKIIAVLQNHSDQEIIWNLTCILDHFIILNILIDSETGKVLKFERKSIMDFVKKVSS